MGRRHRRRGRPLPDVRGVDQLQGRRAVHGHPGPRDRARDDAHVRGRRVHARRLREDRRGELRAPGLRLLLAERLQRAPPASPRRFRAKHRRAASRRRATSARRTRRTRTRWARAPTAARTSGPSTSCRTASTSARRASTPRGSRPRTSSAATASRTARSTASRRTWPRTTARGTSPTEFDGAKQRLGGALAALQQSAGAEFAALPDDARQALQECAL